MHLKKLRNNRIALVESRYVRKGAAGNSHGYSTAVVLCRLPASATALPADVARRLTGAQRDFLEARLLAPNRRREAEARAAAQARELDPGWRLEQAQRLIDQARALSLHQTIDAAALAALRESVGALQPPATSAAQAAAASSPAGDPLESAVEAVAAAARAVTAGCYGQAPPTGPRESIVYARWREINDALAGAGEHSLLRALQRCGWVREKGVDRRAVAREGRLG
jgi:hypothetical protein